MKENEVKEKDVLQQVTGTLTEEPISFEVDYRDLFMRSKKRKFEVKPLVLGSLARISSLYVSIDIEKITSGKSSFEVIKDHSRTVAEIVAIAVTNRKEYPSKKLIDFFFYHLTVNELATLLLIVLKQANVVNFILTIASMRNLNVLESREKKEVSQKSQGS